ncbi:SRPBCC family protein [Streptomyces sp. NPDC002928]|uniref:SRPBCC family protein n=1 Tax=Streptomyces sp. NPDC002928 TaxID=3154440 RepID=UPI0033B38DAA
MDTALRDEGLFLARAQTFVPAAPAEVYRTVSDLPRSGEWSPECTGGTWVAGRAAEVGAVFRGTNHRAADVVGWAPVVRGEWTTEAEVTAAEPGRTFRWAMRDGAGRKQESSWGFDLAEAPGGTLLTHHFRMGRATEGIEHITADMGRAERAQFIREWQVKIERDLRKTVERIAEVVSGQ